MKWLGPLFTFTSLKFRDSDNSMAASTNPATSDEDMLREQADALILGRFKCAASTIELKL